MDGGTDRGGTVPVSPLTLAALRAHHVKRSAPFGDQAAIAMLGRE